MGAGFGELEFARVARALRDDIVLGKRPPGSRLVERDIAEELQVSRLPVREAIRVLVTEGLVVSTPRTCAVVREYSLHDVQDFAQMRLIIERLLFTYATERHDDEGLAQLRAIVEREESAARLGDIRAAQNAANEFHTFMAALAQSAILVELATIFATRLKWIFGLHEDAPAMAAAHRELYEAIASRDVELVMRLLTVHLADGTEAAERRFGVDGVAALEEVAALEDVAVLEG